MRKLPTGDILRKEWDEKAGLQRDALSSHWPPSILLLRICVEAVRSWAAGAGPREAMPGPHAKDIQRHYEPAVLGPDISVCPRTGRQDVREQRLRGNERGPKQEPSPQEGEREQQRPGCPEKGRESDLCDTKPCASPHKTRLYILAQFARRLPPAGRSSDGRMVFARL